MTEQARLDYVIKLICCSIFDEVDSLDFLKKSQNSCERAKILETDSLEPIKFEWALSPTPRLLLPDAQGKLIWDPLAAIFFLASGYELYNHSISRDKHNRPIEADLCTPQANLHRRALCHEWAQELLPNARKPTFRAELQIDVDMPWAYRHKTITRALGGLTRDLINREFNEVKQRTQVLLRRAHDPFDTYQDIIRLASDNEINLRLFFPVGNTSFFDKNPQPKNKAYQALIKQIATQADIGLHPSYDTSAKPSMIQEQISALENICERPVIHSRQHFLKFELPSTFQALHAAGIEHEYSLGYSTDIGFKTGMCVPYPWFDLSTNQETDLLIHPFQIMDVSLNDYLKLDPQAAIVESKTIIDTCKQHGGELCFVWHNSSFHFDGPYWKGWNQVLPTLLEYASN